LIDGLAADFPLTMSPPFSRDQGFRVATSNLADQVSLEDIRDKLV